MTPTPDTPIRHARQPDDPATLAFAGVIARSIQCRRQPLIRGLSENCFQRLLKEYFEDLDYSNTAPEQGVSPVFDEFDELLELLLEHRASEREQNTWLAGTFFS